MENDVNSSEMSDMGTSTEQEITPTESLNENIEKVTEPEIEQRKKVNEIKETEPKLDEEEKLSKIVQQEKEDLETN